MKNTPPQGPVAEALGELLHDMGYGLVEFSAQHVKGRTHVHCVLHHPEGVNLDSLAEVHRAAQPRLEALLDTDDLRIEFASPGIERNVKSFHEFAIFVGRPVQVLPADQDEWRNGTIASADGNSCRVALDDGTEGVYEPATIQKARLLD